MKKRSISMEDLGSIVKHIINGALENTEQMEELRQVIYEEWYFKKMRELKGLQLTSENINSDEEEISATVAHHRLRKPKYKRQLSQSSIKTKKTNSTEIIEDCQTKNSESPVEDNKCQDSLNIQYLPPAADDNQNDLSYPILSSARFNDAIKVSTIYGKDKKTNGRGEVNINLQVIEIWNNPVQRYKLNNGTTLTYQNSTNKNTQNEVNAKLSFESWKRRKSMVYRQMLKEERKEKRQVALAEAAEMHRRKFEQEELQRIKKQQENQKIRRLTRKYLNTINQAEAYQDYINTRKEINEKAFKAWKKRKDMERKQERMFAMAMCKNNICQQRKERNASMTRLAVNVQFDSWLNQLDWVLHEKYLRERRHRVRSFYCQPIYYGDASLCMG